MFNFISIFFFLKITDNEVFLYTKISKKKKKNPDKLGVHEGLGKPAFVGTVGGMYSSVSSGDTLAKGISMTVDKLCEATAP